MRDYVYEMQRIALAIDLDEPSICESIVDGVTDDEYHRSMLYEAHTIKQLKDKLMTYEKTQEKSNRRYDPMTVHASDENDVHRRMTRRSRDRKRNQSDTVSIVATRRMLPTSAHRKERAPNAFRVMISDICRKSVAKRAKTAMLRRKVRK